MYCVLQEKAIKSKKVSGMTGTEFKCGNEMVTTFVVNGKCADMSTVISHNDLVCHRVHRHEPPVTSEPLDIIHMDQDLVVINKPASIPVCCSAC
jgi:23S rRNA-/tRNA-specific pseudouridylate synthase